MVMIRLWDRVIVAERRKEVDLPEPVGPVTRKMPWRLDDDFPNARFPQSERIPDFHAQKDFAAGQQAQETLSPVNRRTVETRMSISLALDPDVDAAILGQTFFRQCSCRHDFDAGNKRGLETFQLRRHGRLMQDASMR